MPIRSLDHYWILETKNTAYAFGLNSAGLLTHSYWGSKLPRIEDYPAPPNPPAWASFNAPSQLTPEEFPAYGDAKYVEPALKATFADGVRIQELAFESAALGDDALDIHLRDKHYPLRVTLRYRVHTAYDLIERSTVIENLGAEPITVERAFSASWHLPRGDGYRLSHLEGRWLDEFHLYREPITPGVKVVESRRITTSHNHSPWFGIDRGSADETQGEVWFGTLAWSGNWKMAVENTGFSSTRVGIGINDWDFAWLLNGGDRLETPASFAGYSSAGFGTASHVLHDYIRNEVLPHGDVPHKVLYNSWEATTFDVNEEGQIALAELAAGMGIELFVVDDGWFHGRNTDNAGLGDWWPDARKFPRGLGPLVERVNALGMDFGIWIEPEMVNPDSELYRTHPDWVLHFPNRTRVLARDQLILNLAREDVRDYLFGHLDKLLSEHNIRFIKWDMNRNVSEPGWPSAPGDQREVWVRYVQGVYKLWGDLRAKHPHVIWQSCSGGGGRADMAILKLADQIWVSDNTEATARLGIQEGFSQVFPANTMEAWVTDAQAKRVPLQFRFHVSMCGSLGVGAHLLHWTPDERALANQMIADYKAVRHVVQQGDQYRLRSPQQHAFSAVQYVAKDRSEGVLFVFRTHLPDPAQLPILRLRGLDPEALYTVEGQGAARSGAAWMHAGLFVQIGDLESRMIRITRVS